MFRKVVVRAWSVTALAVVVPLHAQQESTGRAMPRTRFQVRVENVSTPATLVLKDGTTAPAPTAPVLWAVHGTSDVLFTAGSSDRGLGLESLAEDGDPTALRQSLARAPGVASVGVVNVPDGDTEAGPILPGKSYTVRFEAEPGQRLTLAMMFGQSNDLFYAPNGDGIALFDRAGRAVAGEITGELVLWDAGTEVNQEPGAGRDQAPRQKGPNTGTAENGIVRPVSDGYTYPATSAVVRVTISHHLSGTERR